MKRILFLKLSLLFLFTSGTAHANINKADQTLDRLFQAFDMERLVDSTITTTVNLQIKQNPQLEAIRPEFTDFMQKTVGWKTIEKEFRKLYLKTFTENELADMLKFYETPTGKKALIETPQLLAAGMAIGQARAQEKLPVFQKSIETKLKSINEKTKK